MHIKEIFCVSVFTDHIDYLTVMSVLLITIIYQLMWGLVLFNSSCCSS
uniref:Uncharacterized protein n=1 Tax=Anguilla anguilla TaxID=7936 RepID=A0A0E9VH80_ANGAN